jgi:hypothetical protein
MKRTHELACNIADASPCLNKLLTYRADMLEARAANAESAGFRVETWETGA